MCRSDQRGRVDLAAGHGDEPSQPALENLRSFLKVASTDKQVWHVWIGTITLVQSGRGWEVTATNQRPFVSSVQQPGLISMHLALLMS